MEYSRTPAGWLAGALSLFSDRRDVRSGCYSCGSHSVHGGLLTADRERAAESWDMLRAEAAGALRDDGLVVLARMVSCCCGGALLPVPLMVLLMFPCSAVSCLFLSFYFVFLPYHLRT